MIKQYWENLSPRDQRTIKIGGIILGALFALRLIWWPVYDRVTVLSDEIAREQSLIYWMIPRVDQILEGKQSGQTIKKDKSLPAIEKSLQQAGLKPFVKNLNQNAQRQISISFTQVPFESIMEWLAKAQSQGWVVQQFNATKGEKSGQVQIDVTLS